MPTTSPWTTRVWREFRVGNLTRAMRDSLLTLATYRGAGGLCMPSHATLADRARVCVRTVQRAIEQARDLGLVVATERRVRRGWRWLRTSNSYRLTVPETPLQPGLRPIFRRASTTGQQDRGGESQTSRSAAFQEMMRQATGMPDLLAMRRAAVETQLVRKL
jgi:DNA-binding transcriptional MocR family regulator